MEKNMTPIKKKAVLYARYSSRLQHETSIEAQKDIIYKYAEANGYEIVSEYVDRAKSGTTTTKRDMFNQMLADSASKRFQYVIVHKVDRFARNCEDFFISQQKLTNNGVKLISTSEYIDDSTPAGIISKAIAVSTAEATSRNIASEVHKGFMVNASKCKHNGGKPPLGYNLDTDTGRLIINEYEAQAVRLIFSMYIKGHGYNTISKALNEQGYKTKCGNSFGKNSLYEILHNEKYTGVFVYNKRSGKTNSRAKKSDDEIVRIKGGVPAIISEAEFTTAAAMFEQNKRMSGTNNAKHNYLLSGLIKCGHCGRPLCGCAKKNGKGLKSNNYRCTHKPSDKCLNKEINSDKLDDFVLSLISRHIFSKENIEKLTAAVQKLCAERYMGVDRDIKECEARLKSISIKQNNLLNAIEDGQDSKALMKRLNELEHDEEKVRQRMDELKSQVQLSITEEDILKAIERFSQFIKENKIPECSVFMRKIVDSVVVSRDNIEVTLRVASFLCGKSSAVNIYYLLDISPSK